VRFGKRHACPRAQYPLGKKTDPPQKLLALLDHEPADAPRTHCLPSPASIMADVDTAVKKKHTFKNFMRHKDRQTERKRKRKRQTDRRTDRQAGRQAGRQTETPLTFSNTCVRRGHISHNHLFGDFIVIFHVLLVFILLSLSVRSCSMITIRL
jgi:hypothetical protein